MDKDHDNRLGDNDFSASVREDPLLLSCFGQVFANARVSWLSSPFPVWPIGAVQVIEAFLHLFSENTSVRSHRYWNGHIARCMLHDFVVLEKSRFRTHSRTNVGRGGLRSILHATSFSSDFQLLNEHRALRITVFFFPFFFDLMDIDCDQINKDPFIFSVYGEFGERWLFLNIKTSNLDWVQEKTSPDLWSPCQWSVTL